MSETISGMPVWFVGDWMVKDLAAIDLFKGKGVTVEPISKEIVDGLVRQADIFYDEKAAADPFFAEVLASIRDFQTEYRAAWERL